MSARRLDLGSMSKLAKNLRAMPLATAKEIAKRAAPVISQLSRETFDNSRDPYGAPWVPGVEGQKVTLRDSGKLEQWVKYVVTADGEGTRLRVSLGVPYAKYQIGKRPVYPRAGLLPKKYADELERIARETAPEQFAKGLAA
jgi:hypothetical protein